MHIVAIGLETVNIKPGVSKQLTVSAGHQIPFFSFGSCTDCAVDLMSEVFTSSPKRAKTACSSESEARNWE